MKFVFGLTIIAILGLGIVKVKDSQSKKFIEQTEQPIYVKAIYSMPVSYDPGADCGEKMIEIKKAAGIGTYLGGFLMDDGSSSVRFGGP